MEIEATVRNGVVIIDPKGTLTIETEDDFKMAIAEWLETGWTCLVLDLAHVQYIDNCGLGTIAQAYIWTLRHGGDLKLLHVTGRNHHLLMVTKLLTVFETYDSVDEAENSFLLQRRLPPKFGVDGSWPPAGSTCSRQLVNRL